MSTKVVILMGGPSKGTRFRPLSLNVPKPLFPVAGYPVIHYHVRAASQIPNIKEVLLLGFDDPKQYEQFIADASKEFKVPIRYLKETHGMGTAGGLYVFRDEIMTGDPSHIFVMNCDICSAFPLQEMLDFHKKHGKDVTIMGKRLPHDQAEKQHQSYGAIVADLNSHEVIHYAEKPEGFLSDLINAGVYIFNPSIFELIDESARKQAKFLVESGVFGAESTENLLALQQLYHSSKINLNTLLNSSRGDGDTEDWCRVNLRLEQDVLAHLGGSGRILVYETKDFWLQIKAAGYAVKANEELLRQHSKLNPSVLATSKAFNVKGNVIVHPTATVHPSAVIGPNVSIGPNVKIGAGVRVANSIILDGVELQSHACVVYAIVGWGSVVGQWARVEGKPDFADLSDRRSFGITILGADVTVANEVMVRNCIVLPHKQLSQSHTNEILL